MNNPYQILGVSDNASDAEIKKAYRELAQKYHPDKYNDNPLSSLAEEKLKEINIAYDTITKSRSGKGSNNSYSSSYNGPQNNNSSYSNAGSNPHYSQVRNLISQNQFDAAISALDAMTNHDAEWFFLKGIAYYQKGWFDQAVTHANTAVRMDPSNAEYREFVMRISRQNQSYRNVRNTGSGPDTCDCCGKLICADCCCECMGGDLISCC